MDKCRRRTRLGKGGKGTARKKETRNAGGKTRQGRDSGMGGIGRSLAGKARALGMKVVYHNRNKLGKELSRDEHGYEYEYLGFEELLRESDVISVHVPLSPTTRHMLSDKEFDMMKDGAFIVNTARGAVIDEAALVRALASGKIARAGLDVFEEEPKIHEGLLSSDKVFLLPHVGTYTSDTQKKMEMWAIDNVKAAVEGNLDQMSIIPEHRKAAAGNESPPKTRL